MKIFSALLSSSLLWSSIAAMAATPVELIQDFDLSPDGKTLVFQWHDDIWRVETAGGVAKPLTVEPSTDRYPRVSPDGKQILFNSNRNDNFYAWTMPIEGGVPTQVSSHFLGLSVEDWFPDGASFLVEGWWDAYGDTPRRLVRMYMDQSRASEVLFDDYGNEADVSPDGRKVLFVREGVPKYYRQYHGSKSAQIWLYDLESRQFTEVKKGLVGSRYPVWMADGSGFYYTHEKGGCYNVWAHRFADGSDQQLTFFKNAPVLNPAVSADGKVLVFQQLFDMYRLDLVKGGEPQKIDIVTDLDLNLERIKRSTVDKIWNYSEYGAVDFSPDGLEIVFNAGGRTWAMDTVYRRPIAITTDDNLLDTEVIFGPDLKVIYFLRNDGVGINIWEAKRKNDQLPWWRNPGFEIRQITQDQSARYNLSLSPDKSRFSFTRGRGELCVCNLDGSELKVVHQMPYPTYGSWSPCGKYLLTQSKDDFENSEVMIVSVDEPGKAWNLSQNPGWDGHASWSPDGRKIAFISRYPDNRVRLRYVFLYPEDEGETEIERTLDEAVNTMRGSLQKYPLELIEQTYGSAELVTTSEAPSDETSATDEEASKPTEEAVPVEEVVDFDGLADRVREVPPHLAANPWGPFWSFDSKALAYGDDRNGRKGTYKMGFPRADSSDFMTEHYGYYAQWVEHKSQILWMVDGVPYHFNKALPFKLHISSRLSEHYALAFRQVWMSLRDNFYDAKMNNLDWEAIRDKYEPIVRAQPVQEVLYDAVSMMLGELSASHLEFSVKSLNSFKTGNSWAERTAHLGLLFDPYFEGEGRKITEILSDTPVSRIKALKAGDLLVAINGEKVTANSSLMPFMNGIGPRFISCTFKHADGVERTYQIEAVSYHAVWERLKANALKRLEDRVAELSNGKVGYLQIPEMNQESLDRFKLEVYRKAMHADGLIIDVRNNGGGFTADRILSMICHPEHAMTVPRDGGVSYPRGYWENPVWQKPLVVLCNQNSCSNAEIFTNAIKTIGRGRVVGVPTQGYVISTPTRDILDLAVTRMPDRGWYNLHDGRDLDYYGVVPDFVVWPQPGELPKGIDRQLDKAVEVLLQDIQSYDAHVKPNILPASELYPKEKPLDN